MHCNSLCIHIPGSAGQQLDEQWQQWHKQQHQQVAGPAVQQHQSAATPQHPGSQQEQQLSSSNILLLDGGQFWILELPLPILLPSMLPPQAVTLAAGLLLEISIGCCEAQIEADLTHGSNGTV